MNINESNKISTTQNLEISEIENNNGNSDKVKVNTQNSLIEENKDFVLNNDVQNEYILECDNDLKEK